MATRTQPPNECVDAVYERLDALLAEGDDAFIDAGPSVVQDAIADEAFFERVETARATDGYTRELVYREPDGPVIRFMEWSPEFSLMPHEHHGRPCFEVLVEGHLCLSNMTAREVSAGEYELDIVDTEVCGPGDAGVVDPRGGSDIHAVYSPVRSRSLHVYPDDNHYGTGYVQTDDENDCYERKKFQLRE
jgi:hypothetical protein